MGTELELKLRLEDETQLEAVLGWELLPMLRIGSPYEFQMQTTYFDTKDRRFSERHWGERRGVRKNVPPAAERPHP